MDQIKRNVGDIWKDGKDWMVQFPKGKMPFKTEKMATLFAETLKNVENLKVDITKRESEVKGFREQYQVICHSPKSKTLKEYLVLNSNGGRYYKSIDSALEAIEKHKKTKFRGFTSYNGIGVEIEIDSEYVKELKAETYSIQKRYITEWEDTEYKGI